MNPTGHFKLCPNCKTPAFLQETVCRNCGRQFSNLPVQQPQSYQQSYQQPYPQPHSVHKASSPAYSQADVATWTVGASIFAFLSGISGIALVKAGSEWFFQGEDGASTFILTIIGTLLFLFATGLCLRKTTVTTGYIPRSTIIAIPSAFLLGIVVIFLQGAGKKIDVPAAAPSSESMNYVRCVEQYRYVYHTNEGCGLWHENRLDQDGNGVVSYNTTSGESVVVSAFDFVISRVSVFKGSEEIYTSPPRN